MSNKVTVFLIFLAVFILGAILVAIPQSIKHTLWPLRNAPFWADLLAIVPMLATILYFFFPMVRREQSH